MYSKNFYDSVLDKYTVHYYPVVKVYIVWHMRNDCGMSKC